MGKVEPEDLLTIVSLIHRRLDRAHMPARVSGEEKIGVGLTMPTAWRYGSPGAMPPAAVNAFNSLIHTIASQLRIVMVDL